MSLTRSQMDEELQKLYDRIPRIPDCDGRCWTSCGPIDMSDRERQRIRQAGYKLTPFHEARKSLETFYCEALTADKRCAVYEMRPLICRLWGAVESMPCVYGCMPEGGWLTDREAWLLVAESLRISGHPVAMTDQDVEAAFARGALRERMDQIREQGQRNDWRRADENVPAAFRRAEARTKPAQNNPNPVARH